MSNAITVAQFNTAEKNSAITASSLRGTPNIYMGKRIKPSSFDDDYFVSSDGTLKNKKASSSVTDTILARYAPKFYLNKYMNAQIIQKALDTNPKITEILSEKNLPAEIHMENITGNNGRHFVHTGKKAKELGSGLSYEKQTKLIQAALLHDIGKVFIPPDILNKTDKLTDEEREIISLHAALGAEILKTTDADKSVVDAVALHHMPCDDFRKQRSEIAQILSVADVYSALKEERPYKPELSLEKVKQIMEDDDNLSTDIVSKLFFEDDSI